MTFSARGPARRESTLPSTRASSVASAGTSALGSVATITSCYKEAAITLESLWSDNRLGERFCAG